MTRIFIAPEKLIEMTGDGLRCLSTRIEIKMSVALSGRHLCMAQKTGQHRQSETQAHGGTSERVT